MPSRIRRRPITLDIAELTDMIRYRYRYELITVMNGHIRALRQQRALSLTDLSEISGIGRVTINRIANGKQRPHPRTIRALAEALGVDVEELTSRQSRML